MFAKEKCMNISNAQDVYTSLLGQLFIGEKKTLPSKSIYSPKRPVFALWLSSTASIQKWVVSMFNNKGVVDKFEKNLTQTNCHYPIL